MVKPIKVVFWYQISIRQRAWTEQHLEARQGKNPSVLLDRGLLSSESGHLDLAAVFTSSMPRSNHPQMFFFLPNETYLEQETAKCWSRLRWRFIFWCDFQHNNLARAATPIGRLRRMYTQILMFKNTTAAKCLKADFSGCAVWKGKTGVIIMAQTFWACTHGLSDSGKQSAMGSGSCGYQRV